jgi:hypothetical protein
LTTLRKANPEETSYCLGMLRLTRERQRTSFFLIGRLLTDLVQGLSSTPGLPRRATRTNLAADPENEEFAVGHHYNVAGRSFLLFALQANRYPRYRWSCRDENGHRQIGEQLLH